jgi:hypothetical protein
MIAFTFFFIKIYIYIEKPSEYTIAKTYDEKLLLFKE